MKRYISLLLGVVLLFGGNNLGEIIFPDFESYISLGCIAAGGILISYAVYGIFSECSQNKKDTLEKITEVVQKENVIQIDQLKKIEIACMNLAESQIKADESNQESLKRIEDTCQEIVELQKDGVVTCTDKINEVITASDNLARIEKDASQMQLKQLEAIQSHDEEVMRLQKEAGSIWEGRFGEINQFFQCVLQACDELEDAQKKALAEEGTILKRMSEDIQSENARLIRKISASMEDMEETLEQYEQDNSENFQKLAEEYQQFQKLTEGIIERMTLMSEQDYEVLKGMLNE